jgi:hypothetical protein
VSNPTEYTTPQEVHDHMMSTLNGYITNHAYDDVMNRINVETVTLSEGTGTE